MGVGKETRWGGVRKHGGGGVRKHGGGGGGVGQAAGGWVGLGNTGVGCGVKDTRPGWGGGKG